MMSIGEFAALTGLTVRALRHYDEQGVLTPAAVDPSSRYRRYSAEQLPAAMKLAALRRAELPLPEVSRVLAGEAELTDVIAAQRTRLREELASQEAKLTELELLASFEKAVAAKPESAPVIIEERAIDPGDWAGVEIVFDEEFLARTRDLAEQVAQGAVLDLGEDPSESVPRSLTAAGIPPVGPSWISLELREDEAPRMIMCWAVPRPVPDDWAVPGERAVSGRTEAGRELVARGPYESLSIFEQAGQLAGVVAVLREAERRGLAVDLNSLRLFRSEPPPADGAEVTEFETAVPLVAPNVP